MQMRLRVHHRTEYIYTAPVIDSVNEVRLCPPDNTFQTCESSFISVLPTGKLTHYIDLNGNKVNHFEISEPHSRLTIESRAVVTTRNKVNFDNLPFGFHHGHLGKCRSMEECYTYIQNSAYVERTPEIWKEALDIQGFSEDVFQTSYCIMEYIFENYDYQSGATTVSTHASEVIKKQQGVCQDFAHAMVSFCRAIGIPARYVSGYFFDATRDNSMRGSQASHAWVEVFIDGVGWIGLDPTNNKVTDETYIILARGRDYRDVAPVTGVYNGIGRSGMQVHVSVKRLPDNERTEVSVPVD